MSDLITSARAKQNLNQSTFTSAEDDTIDALITAVSKAIKRYCRREFDLQTFDAVYNGSGDRRLILHEYPIVSVNRVAMSPTVALRVKNTDSANQRATVHITSTGLNLVTVASGTTTTESEITWSGNATITAVKDAIIAKGNGWAAEVVGDFDLWASSELAPTQGMLNLDSTVRPQGAFNAAGRWAPISIWTEEIASYDIDVGRGMLIKGLCSDQSIWPQGFRNVRVIFTAGYATVPEDIQEAAAQWVAALFWQTKDNPAVYPDFPSASIAMILDHYRRCGI